MLVRAIARSFSTTAQPKKVGFIGMGNMGLSMAGNLVKNGFVVKGFDLSESTRSKAEGMVSIIDPSIFTNILAFM